MTWKTFTVPLKNPFSKFNPVGKDLRLLQNLPTDERRNKFYYYNTEAIFKRMECNMNTISSNLPSRAGENHRGNPDRYFHVMTEGWFIYTREGVRGPFVDRNLALSFLQSHISDIKPSDDPSSSWRL